MIKNNTKEGVHEDLFNMADKWLVVFTISLSSACILLLSLFF